MSAIAPCCWLAAFLIGGIPFGFLVGRYVLKDDIRNHGSGNIGATNVARVIGWKWGGLVLLLDALKGAGPTLGTQWVLARLQPEGSHSNAVVVAGICAVIGHMYPVYLRLRGGKGVATALGVVCVIAPFSTALAFLCFLLVVAATRLVALASISAAVCFLCAQLWILRESALQPDQLGQVVFSIVVPALIVWRHRGNIRRIVDGTEPRMGSSDVPGEVEDSRPIPTDGN